MSDRFVRRCLLLPVLVFLFGWLAPAILADDSPQRLRVLSYNIHHGEGVDGVLDLPRIARVIRSVDPDVVALQEVDQNVERTGTVDQPTELARLTEMEVVFGANIELQGGHYGNAILSRLPIVRHTNHRLPSRDDGEQRGVLAAELSLPGTDAPPGTDTRPGTDTPPGTDKSLAFLATHFDHRRDDRERLASAKAVDMIVSRKPRKPTILAGDLNDVPASRVLGALGGAWKRTNDEPLPTIPVDQPTRQIDYILVRPAERWRVIEVRVLEESVASDHRAIFAELELLPARPWD